LLSRQIQINRNTVHRVFLCVLLRLFLQGGTTKAVIDNIRLTDRLIGPDESSSVLYGTIQNGGSVQTVQKVQTVPVVEKHRRRADTASAASRRLDQESCPFAWALSPSALECRTPCGHD
jgi:hypothetical protein